MVVRHEGGGGEAGGFCTKFLIGWWTIVVRIAHFISMQHLAFVKEHFFTDDHSVFLYFSDQLVKMSSRK